MSIRPGKGRGQAEAAAAAAAAAAEEEEEEENHQRGAATTTTTTATTNTTNTTHDPLTDQAGPIPAKGDRIYVDNSSLSELKATCDEAVERILTRPSGHISLAPDSSDLSSMHSPSASSTDLSTSTSSLNGQAAAPAEFPPFKVSHVHTDVRLALGFTASAVIIGVCLWSYFIEKDWEKSKGWTAVAVAAYAVLSALQALDAYLQGDRIFVGKRKMLSKRIETELLTIASPSLRKPTVETAQDGQKWIVPPRYTVLVEFTRRSNGGKSLLRRVKQSVELGHLGEWFTQEGEFVEAIFEKKLIAALEKSWSLEEE